MWCQAPNFPPLHLYTHTILCLCNPAQKCSRFSNTWSKLFNGGVESYPVYLINFVVGMGYVAWEKALHLGWYRARWKLRQSVRGAGGGFLYPFQDARFLARFLAPLVDRYSKWRTVSQVTSHEAASACTDQFKIKVRNNESAIMILNFF